MPLNTAIVETDALFRPASCCDRQRRISSNTGSPYVDSDREVDMVVERCDQIQ